MTGSSEPPIKLSVSATAKLEVKTEIPSDVSGRLVSAITDVIRPWTENRGLKADLIQLQRAEVALKIAERAREIASVEDLPLRPIPTKVLVPLLERASLEDPDDEFMIECWAGLLASSGVGDETSPRFASLLSELNGRQARELMALYQAGGGAFTVDGIRDSHAFIKEVMGVQPSTTMSAAVSSSMSFAKERLLERGFRLVQMSIVDYSAMQSPHYQRPRISMPAEATSIDISILSSMGLIAYNPIRTREYQVETEITFYGLTSLGLKLIEMCKPRRTSS